MDTDIHKRKELLERILGRVEYLAGDIFGIEENIKVEIKEVGLEEKEDV